MFLELLVWVIIDNVSPVQRASAQPVCPSVRPAAGQVDDVLDRLRSVHRVGDHHGLYPGLVSG